MNKKLFIILGLLIVGVIAVGFVSAATIDMQGIKLNLPDGYHETFHTDAGKDSRSMAKNDNDDLISITVSSEDTDDKTMDMSEIKKNESYSEKTIGGKQGYSCTRPDALGNEIVDFYYTENGHTIRICAVDEQTIESIVK